MPDFIINTPQHTRWWLPDRQHQFNSFIYSEFIYVSIIRAYDGRTIISVPPIKMEGNWQDNYELTQELARKRFADRSIRRSLPKVLERGRAQ